MDQDTICEQNVPERKSQGHYKGKRERKMCKLAMNLKWDGTGTQHYLSVRQCSFNTGFSYPCRIKKDNKEKSHGNYNNTMSKSHFERSSWQFKILLSTACNTNWATGSPQITKRENDIFRIHSLYARIVPNYIHDDQIQSNFQFSPKCCNLNSKEEIAFFPSKDKKKERKKVKPPISFLLSFLLCTFSSLLSTLFSILFHDLLNFTTT